MRKAAASALGKIKNDDAVPKLIDALRDPDAQVRKAATGALVVIRGADAVPQLIDALSDPDVKVRDYAVYALGRIGDSSRNTLSKLIDVLQDPDALIRQHAVKAISRIGQPTTHMISALCLALRDLDVSVRATAVEALARMGDAAAEAVDNLIEALGDLDAWVRSQVASALQKIAPTSPVVVEAIRTYEIHNTKTEGGWDLKQVKGIAIMGSERLKKDKDALDVFLQIGEWCEQNFPDTWEFSFKQLARDKCVYHADGEPVSVSNLRLKMTQASLFFQEYFRDHEGLKDVAADDAPLEMNSFKVVARTPKGHQGPVPLPHFCHSLGLRALKLVSDYNRELKVQKKPIS